MKYIVLTCFMLCLLPFVPESFGYSRKKAVRLYKKGIQAWKDNPQEAYKLYYKAIEADETYKEPYVRLIGHYYRDPIKYMSELEKLFQLMGESLPDYQGEASFRLGNLYYGAGEYKKALTALEKHIGFRDKDRSEMIKLCKGAIKIKERPERITLLRLPDEVNSIMDEYWAALSLDMETLYFCRQLMEDNGALNEDIYIATRNDTGGWNEAEPIPGALNSEFNEGFVSITADQKWLYVTICNAPDGYGSCDIYMCYNQNGKWSKPVNAGPVVNSRFWESTPSVAPNGKVLYFASSRLGYGSKDIWKTEFKGLDSFGYPIFSKPQNLGPVINTRGNETAPYIAADGKTLYFASDTHQGLGKLDIFQTTQIDSGKWTAPRNLGYPINTHLQEEGFFIAANGRTAYVTQHTPTHRRDIFYFEMPSHLFIQPVFAASGNHLITTEQDAIIQSKRTILKGVTFPTDQSEIEATSFETLEKVFQFLAKYSEVRIEIQGHTDNVASDDYNMELSQKRAQAVFDWLANKGIAKTRMKAVGYGSAQPIADNRTEEGRAQNRRTEIIVQ